MEFLKDGSDSLKNEGEVKVSSDVTQFNGTQTQANSRFNLQLMTSLDDDQNTDDSPVPYFHTNTGGIPIDDQTWSRMWKKVCKIHPEGEKMCNSIRANPNLSIQPHPAEPNLNISGLSVVEKIHKIQQYLCRLEYNHTGTQFFHIKTSRCISRLMGAAKDIIKYSLPIKCLEAVIVALYLSAPIQPLSRFTIRFKSKSGGKVHRHIVLGLYSASFYGAVGLSRRDTLMDKPMKYKSLSDLIFDYRDSYRNCCHTLLKVKFSTVIPSDRLCNDKIYWDHYSTPLSKLSDDEAKILIDKYSREMKTNLF